MFHIITCTSCSSIHPKKRLQLTRTLEHVPLVGALLLFLWKVFPESTAQMEMETQRIIVGILCTIRLVITDFYGIWEHLLHALCHSESAYPASMPRYARDLLFTTLSGTAVSKIKAWKAWVDRNHALRLGFQKIVIIVLGRKILSFPS